MISRFCKKEIGKTAYWLALVSMLLVRFAIAGSQRVFLLPEGSSIDDMLMVRAAQELVVGNWLGAYSGVSIAKNMGFAPWLTFLHSLGVPLLLANTALWVFASGVAARAMRPFLTGNASRLFAFGLLLFQPVSFAFFNQRVYRDSIFSAFCLLLFGGILGFAFRLSEKGVRGSLFSCLASAVGMTGIWLLREDGMVLLLFAFFATLAIAIFLLFQPKTPQKKTKLLLSAMPFVSLAIGYGIFAWMNYQYYGIFLLNDMTEGAFPATYGALVAVSEGETGFTAKQPVSLQALEKIYEEVPSMAVLEPYLEKGSTLHNGFRRLGEQEYGGSFYFALRLAASPEYGNQFSDGKTAQNYWGTMEKEIRQAVEEGRLQSVQPKSSTIPRWNKSLLSPTVKEFGKAAITLLTFQQTDPRPLESIGETEKIEQVAAFVNAPIQKGYVAGTDIPYYNPIQKIVFAFCDGVTWLYRITIWPFLLFGCMGLFQRGKTVFLKKSKKEERICNGLYTILLLGLLCSVLLRLFVSAFMEAASFGVGPYIMYLSSAMPPLLLFCVFGLAAIPKAEEENHFTLQHRNL